MSTRLKVLLNRDRSISSQIKTLRKYRKDIGVERYVESIRNSLEASDYVNYLIDRYYYQLDVPQVKRTKNMRLTAE